MKPLKTPLYEDVKTFCSKRASDLATESGQGQSFTLTAVTRKGLEVEYSQIALPDGDYSERLSLRKGSYSQIHENKVRDIEGALLLGSGKGSSYVFKQYGQSPVSIKSLIELIVREYAKKESPAYFARDFHAEFATINGPDCDHLYILTEDDLVHVGGREFFETANRSEDLMEGLKTAYDTHRADMRSIATRSLDQALTHVQRGTLTRGEAGSRIALFSRHQPQKIIAKAVFDVDAFQMNQFFIGDLEIRLANHEQYLPTFFSNILTPNIFDIISNKFGMSKEETLRSIHIAEKSGVVRHREQMKGIEDKQSEDPETAIEDKLGIAARELFDEVTSEFQDIIAHMIVYDDFQFWKELKETLGMRFADRLNMIPEGMDKREWDADWVRRIADAYSCLGSQQHTLDGMNYDMLLHISPERHPTIDNRSHKYKRTGIGNMIIDLGDKNIAGQIDFSQQDAKQALARHYYENKQHISGYLFKGRMLRLVLEDVFDREIPSGGTVAVSTVDERVEEMVRFSRHKKTEWSFDGQNLRYKGVQIAFLGK